MAMRDIYRIALSWQSCQGSDPHKLNSFDLAPPLASQPGKRLLLHGWVIRLDGGWLGGERKTEDGGYDTVLQYKYRFSGHVHKDREIADES